MIRTSSILFWFGMTIIASLALYRTSNRVHEMNMELRDINTAINAEQQNLHVLKAEWVYLANPARIEAAAKKHLATRPTSPQQITALNTLPEALPSRSEAVASVAVTGMPIATIKSTFKSTLTAMLPRSIAMVTSKHKDKVAAPIAVASADTGHINDHMIMQHTASAQPLPGSNQPDSIGSLLNDLGANQ
jgi:cell division protein FtsL